MAKQRPVLLGGREKGISEAYRRLKIPYREADSVGEWVRYKVNGEGEEGRYVRYEVRQGRIPNCFGMTAKDAIAMLNEAGYRARVRGYGKVVSQSPSAGQAAKGGAMVDIVLK